MDQFPIRVIAELSGVSPTTLRAWERRYGLLKPTRTPSGHRLYNSHDLSTVKRVLRLLDAGQPIREAAKRVKDNLDDLPPAQPTEHWQLLRRRMHTALGCFDQQKLDSVYNEALSQYPFELVSEQLVVPLLKELGERWQHRPSGIAEEHFFCAYLRNKLGSRLHHEGPRSRGCALILACVPGERHEIGLLLFALAALGRGYRVIYFGSDLPLEQIPPVVERTAAGAVVLSATSVALPLDALATLCDKSGVPICVGGCQAELHQQSIRQAGAHPVSSRIAPALTLIEQLAPAHAQR